MVSPRSTELQHNAEDTLAQVAKTPMNKCAKRLAVRQAERNNSQGRESKLKQPANVHASDTDLSPEQEK